MLYQEKFAKESMVGILNKLLDSEIVLYGENKRGVKIATIEGAEVLKIAEGRQGEIKHNCVFSKSLLYDFMINNGVKIKNGKTRDIINVCFNYGYKDLGFSKLNDKIKLLKEEIKNIRNVNKWLKAKNKKLKSKEIENTIELNKKDIDLYNLELNRTLEYIEDKVNINKGNIRKKLYNDGFKIDYYKTVKGEKRFDKTIEYVYLFRTAGKAKDGTDYFINKKIFKRISNWQNMGRKLPKKDIDLVGNESYKSLTSSAIEGYITFKPNEILIVKDLDCYSGTQKVIEVYRDDKDGLSKARHTYSKCKNTIWDGMGLIQGGEGFRGLRHHYFKIGAFCSDFQQYFKDYYGDEYETATIEDMFGRKVVVKDIKMITTENAIKWIKFDGCTKESFENWCNWIEENGCKFGVCKRDHRSKYEDLQRMSYQMSQTLPLTREQLKRVFKTTNDFINGIQNDKEEILKHMKRTANEININNALIDIVNKCPSFINSKLFKDEQYKAIKDFKKNIKKGKIVINGDNETIVGNPFLLLEYVTGQLNEYITDGVINGYLDKSLPNKNSCYCKRFNHDEKLGAFRSPHNSPNNTLIFKNDYNEDIMNKYFYNIGYNVIVANMLYNDVQDRGNGLDEDTDFLLVTNDIYVYRACLESQKFPTIVNKFKKSTIKYNNSMDDLTIVDNMLQQNQKAIGTSSNVAQLYMSQYWEIIDEIEQKQNELGYNSLYLGETTEEIEELKQRLDSLLDSVAILSVLAQVAIDSAKRQFIVGENGHDLNKEINRLRKELPMKAKPTFWQYTSIAYDNKEIEKRLKNNDINWNKYNKSTKEFKIKQLKKDMIEELVDYNCPMNWILEEVELINNKTKVKKLSNDNFLIIYGTNKTQRRNQCKRIESIIEKLTNECKIISQDYSINKDDKYEIYEALYDEALSKINGLKISLDTMSVLITRALSENNYFNDNGKIRNKLLNILYRYNKNYFLKCFEENI